MFQISAYFTTLKRSLYPYIRKTDCVRLLSTFIGLEFELISDNLSQKQVSEKSVRKKETGTRIASQLVSSRGKEKSSQKYLFIATRLY
jgi:hypothetical protein